MFKKYRFFSTSLDSRRRQREDLYQQENGENKDILYIYVTYSRKGVAYITIVGTALFNGSLNAVTISKMQ